MQLSKVFPFQDEHEKLTLFSFHAPGVLIKLQRERLSSIESLVCLGETNPESLLYIWEEEINSDAGGIQLGADWLGFLVHSMYFFVIKVILVSHHEATSYDCACSEFLSLCPHLCHDRVTPRDSARPLVCYRLKSDRNRTPPTLRIHLRSDS